MESSGPLKTPAPFFLLTAPLIPPRNSTIPIRPPITVTTSAATNSSHPWSSTGKSTSVIQPASPSSGCCLSLSRVRSVALLPRAGWFLEFRQRGNAECFENLNLNFVRDRVYFLHAWPARSDAIPKRPLAARRFDDLPHKIGHFLRVRARVYQLRHYFLVQQRHFAVTALAPGVFSAFQLIYRACAIPSPPLHPRAPPFPTQFLPITFP